MNLTVAKGLSDGASLLPELPPKNELIKLLNDFLQVLESEIFSTQSAERVIQGKLITGENIGEEQEMVIEWLRGEIEGFIQSYGHIFRFDHFHDAFSRERSFGYMSKGDLKKEVDRLIEVLSHAVAMYTRDNNRDAHNINHLAEDSRNTCRGKLARLSYYNRNIPGYIVFRMFVNDIEKIQHTQEVFNCAEILQNSTLIQGSVLGQWLNNFLQKHISFLSIDQIQTLLRSSDKGEEVLNNILSLPEISALRFQVCVWIIRYSSKEEVYESYINKTYEPYRKKIFDSCVAYMEQVLPEEQFDILPISFMKIYRYWNEVRGTYSTEERKRIQQAFERYGENYSQDIFLNEINPGSLPVSCAVKATRRESEAILNNIKYEAKVRSEGTPANVRVSSIIENILMGSKALQDPREYSVPNGRYIAETLSFSYNKEPMAIGDWQEYARIRKEKPRKGSEEAEKIREIRRTLRYTTEPVAIRQWLYSTLVEKVYGYGTQIWPRFDETRVYDNTPKLPQCETRLSDDTIRLAYQGGNTLPSVEAVVSF